MSNTNKINVKEFVEENVKDCIFDTSLHSVYWFNNETEARLIYVYDDMPEDNETEVICYYFPGTDTIPDSVCSSINKSQIRKLNLPNGWGTWDDGVVIYSRQ